MLEKYNASHRSFTDPQNDSRLDSYSIIDRKMKFYNENIIHA